MKQPKTGQVCGCKRGVERDNCPQCEGTGMRIDFRAIRQEAKPATHTPGPIEYTTESTPRMAMARDYFGPGFYELTTDERAKTIAYVVEPEYLELFAAAPELLDAIKELQSMFGYGDDVTDNQKTVTASLSGDDSKLRNLILEITGAAIARAEGGK